MKSMFDNYKTARYFAKIIMSCSGKKVGLFTKRVHDLYDEKITSQKELPTYKITSKDLNQIKHDLNIK